MIKIKFDFCTMYEPGENAPPQFTKEETLETKLSSTPRFKDQVKYKHKDYIVWDVGYDLDFDYVYIKAVRRVTYPPTSR